MVQLTLRLSRKYLFAETHQERVVQAQPRICSPRFPHLSCGGDILSEGGLRFPLLLEEALKAPVFAVDALQRFKPLDRAK